MAEEFTPSLEIAFHHSLLFTSVVEPVLVFGRRELILLRENMSVLSNNLGFSRKALNVFINDICTALLGLIHPLTILRHCLLLL